MRKRMSRTNHKRPRKLGPHSSISKFDSAWSVKNPKTLANQCDNIKTDAKTSCKMLWKKGTQ